MNQQPSAFMSLMPLILIFAVFYFLLIYPMQKKQKKHQRFLQELKKGDPVITNGGIYGTIQAVEDDIVVLKVGDGVKIKVSRSAIAGYQPDVGGQSRG